MPLREALYTILPSNDSTLAIELFKSGLMRRKKHTLFFENFSGELSYAGKPFSGWLKKPESEPRRQ